METTIREEKLFKIFNNVNDWLKFAEAKNAALVAFNGVSIFGIIQAFQSELIKDDWLCNYLQFIIVLLIFSTITSLISFAPKVKMVKLSWAKPSGKNVLFFEYLKTLDNTEILKQIFEGVSIEFTNFEKDLAEQIKQNSYIASKKYGFFSIALWITIAAYITLPLALIFFLYTYFSK